MNRFFFFFNRNFRAFSYTLWMMDGIKMAFYIFYKHSAFSTWALLFIAVLNLENQFWTWQMNCIYVVIMNGIFQTSTLNYNIYWRRLWSIMILCVCVCAFFCTCDIATAAKQTTTTKTCTQRTYNILAIFTADISFDFALFRRCRRIYQIKFLQYSLEFEYGPVNAEDEHNFQEFRARFLAFRFCVGLRSLYWSGRRLHHRIYLFMVRFVHVVCI